MVWHGHQRKGLTVGVIQRSASRFRPIANSWPCGAFLLFVVAAALVLVGVPSGASAQSITTRTITIVSGNNQAGTVNAPLPAPLVVRVTQGGSPVTGATVAWSITSGSGTLAAPTSGTDASGQASNTLTPTGPTTQVTASVLGLAGPVTVTF